LVPIYYPQEFQRLELWPFQWSSVQISVLGGGWWRKINADAKLYHLPRWWDPTKLSWRKHLLQGAGAAAGIQYAWKSSRVIEITWKIVLCISFQSNLSWWILALADATYQNFGIFSQKMDVDQWWDCISRLIPTICGVEWTKKQENQKCRSKVMTARTLQPMFGIFQKFSNVDSDVGIEIRSLPYSIWRRMGYWTWKSAWRIKRKGQSNNECNFWMGKELPKMSGKFGGIISNDGY